MCTDLVRLNDASGDLDGPGHAVARAEFGAHMSFYPDTTLPFKPLSPTGLLTPAEAAPLFDTTDGATPTDESEVRTGDRVRVACFDTLSCGQPASECFWIDVRAVVPFPPTIIGTAVVTLYWLPAPGQTKPLDDSTLLKVPLARVLEVKSGAAW